MRNAGTNVPSRAPVIFRSDDGVATRVRSIDESDLIAAWRIFSDPAYIAKNMDLAIATDRLGKAYAERDPSDRLVDTMIAIEALYGRGSSVNVELPYRLSLRAARYIAEELDLTQQQTFQLAKCGFMVRGKILRNLPLEAADFDGAGDLKSFGEQLGRLARITLRKMAFEASPSAEEWKRLILSKKPSTVEGKAREPKV